MKHTLSLIFLFSLSFGVCYSQETERVFRKIVVTGFEVNPEMKFPDTYHDILMSEIENELLNHKKLLNLKVFVNKATDSSTRENPVNNVPEDDTPLESILYLTGTITQYKEGSRKTRYWVGFGAGRSKLKARIKITDSKGNILLEKDVDGNVVWGGMLTRDTGEINSGLAKELAKVVAKKFFKDE
jgi:hypothetical protein